MSDSFSGLGGLPTFRSSARITPVGPAPKADVGDLGGGRLMALSRSMAGVAQALGGGAERIGVDEGRREGQNVVIDRDPATGMPVPPAERATGFGALWAGNCAFDAAARQAYLDTNKQDVATALVDLAQAMQASQYGRAHTGSRAAKALADLDRVVALHRI